MLRTKRWLLGLGVVGAVLLSDRLTFAQTEAEGTLVQDTFIRRARPDDFYGFNVEFLSGNVADDWRTDALIQFDLPELPAGQHVQNANLDLFHSQLEWANRGNAEFGVMAVMFPWSEEDDTWDTIGDGDYGDTVYDVQEFLGVDPPDLSAREDLFPQEWVTWDVTELVQAWYDGSIENNGVAVVGMATQDGDGAGLFPRFYSQDYLDDETLHPSLSITFGVGVGLPLQAGDADMDCDVDQLDLVQVLAAGKYLTAEAATWGEGDWNGAPGGSVNDKIAPPGNGRFDQTDIVAALTANLYLKGSYCPDEAFAAMAMPVAEPSTGVLVAVGFTILLLIRRRR